ncbi:MAG TPA: alpha/beta hydrolase [Cytophagales bacterium]|nr:alpha/beta hydrolase [Cytophagales bacterium]HAA17866.1 alpha/beta hydrolase [Cytophagales bacterium]HAP58212.1 alpha/beta hydrolase [Cytophagales bacterium]
MFFLHGGGERGDGKYDLDYVLIHGPLYEAWIRHRELPFIMVAPQLPYFGREADYADRSPDLIPERVLGRVPEYPDDYRADRRLSGHSEQAELPTGIVDLPDGWSRCVEDLNQMLAQVKQGYAVDEERVYLTGISYGGFGTWQWAHHNPELFAAIAPVVGWGHPSLMEPIAEAELPVWQFIGGRDNVVEEELFYPGLNKLEELGHPDVRVTVHGDMGHLAWLRVYGGQDLYDWFLSHTRNNR